MGCDVHDFVELWNGERWTWMRDEVFADWRNRPTCHPLDRSYALFGLLAGVQDRNVPVIHEPRGLPADLSPELREKFGFTFPDDCPHGAGGRRCTCVYEYSGLFGHSWATGAELLAYDFGRTLPCPGCHDTDCLQHSYHWCQEPADHRITLEAYVGEGWVQTLRQVAGLASDPAHVRLVYAFDN